MGVFGDRVSSLFQSETSAGEQLIRALDKYELVDVLDHHNGEDDPSECTAGWVGFTQIERCATHKQVRSRRGTEPRRRWPSSAV